MPKGDERTGEDEGQGDRGRDREGEAHDGLLRAKASVRWNDPPGPAAPPDCRSAVAQPGDTPAFTSALLSRDQASVTSHVPAPSSLWSRAPPCGEYADSVDQTAARAS